jgi:hypothetical protein
MCTVHDSSGSPRAAAVATEIDSARRASALAAGALLLFGALLGVPLSAWLQRASEPMSWKALLTIACMLGSFASSAAVWRAESRLAAIAGLAVMLASIARVGAPADWTGYSFLMIAGTFVLIVPVLHASLTLK